MPRRFSCVLFDLDGTLLDSTRLIIESYRHTLTAVGCPPPGDAEIIAGFGTSLRRNLERLGPPDRVDEMMALYSAYNGRHHDRMVRAFPDAARVVNGLAASGLDLGIVTGKRRRYASMGLAFLGLEDRFRTVITPERTQHGKPHPEPVLTALSDLERRPEEALFVGDSVHDLAAGRAAGVAVAAAAWGPFDRSALIAREPDYLLDALPQVLTVGLGAS